MKAILIEKSIKTVSLRDVYKEIYLTDDDLVFLPFLAYHTINYEVGAEVFKAVGTDNKSDLLMTYAPICHLLIDLRNHFAGFEGLDFDYEFIYNRILFCMDKVNEIFNANNQ